MQPEITLVVQIITLAIALLGAVLGIINTWQGLNKSRVKIKVLPAHAIPFGNVDPNLKFCIGVTNLSDFSITIDEVGVLFHSSPNRGVVNPVFEDRGDWPRRLKPRSSITIYSQIPASKDGQRIKCAYAKTQCGVLAKGNSQALKQISREQML